MKKETILNQLDGRELAEAVATKVMRWTALREPGKAHLWVESGHFISGWRPDRDIADAWLVEERIEELDLIDEYCIQLTHIVNSHWDEGADYQPFRWELIHATAEDRCRAALMAAEAEQTIKSLYCFLVHICHTPIKT